MDSGILLILFLVSHSCFSFVSDKIPYGSVVSLFEPVLINIYQEKILTIQIHFSSLNF